MNEVNLHWIILVCCIAVTSILTTIIISYNCSIEYFSDRCIAIFGISFAAVSVVYCLFYAMIIRSMPDPGMKDETE